MEQSQKLIRVKRLDSVPLEKVEYTPEGFLIDMPIVTSVGIFDYHNPDGSVRRELRLPEYVFDEKSLETYEGKPVIITHEAGRVNKDNVTGEIVGTILSKGYQDGDDVRAKIIIHDIDSVKRSGFRELSLGYDLELNETPGEWNGQKYDSIQTDIVINHLAVVREARAGEQARLNIDEKTNTHIETDLKGENQEMSTKTNKDDIPEKLGLEESINVNPTGEVNQENSPENKKSIDERVQLIKDRRDRRDSECENNPDQSKGIIARQDEDIEELLEIISELQAEKDMSANKDSDIPDIGVTNPSDSNGGELEIKDGDKEIIIKTDSISIDKMITERLKLGRIGDKLNLDSLETLKPLEAKKRVINKIKPNLKLDGKNETYINTAFDIAVQEFETRKDTEYQRKQMFNSDGMKNIEQNKNSANSAREQMIEKMLNGGNE